MHERDSGTYDWIRNIPFEEWIFLRRGVCFKWSFAIFRRQNSNLKILINIPQQGRTFFFQCVVDILLNPEPHLTNTRESLCLVCF